MIRTFIIISFLFCFAADAQVKIYDPSANAEKDIELAIKLAKKENKFVLIQAGGNWCTWCLEFPRIGKTDPQLDSVIKSGFVWYHLNWSKENKNEKILAKLNYPQRFGFPVFIILDEKGERIHTQNSVYLEDGKKSYNRLKVQEFLEMWSPRALNPAMYSGN